MKVKGENLLRNYQKDASTRSVSDDQDEVKRVQMSPVRGEGSWRQQLSNIYGKYDRSVLIVMCFTYFLQGFRTFQMLSVKDFFRLYLKLEADYTQFLVSMVILPWSFKIIYGLIADNFPIYGSRRKSYIIINGFSQFLTLLILAFQITTDEVIVTALLALNSINMAFIDVVVDALVVQQSRKDFDEGSEDLQGLNWIFMGIGGIIGSVCSAFFTQYLEPKNAFLVASFFGLIMVCFALTIDVASESISFTEQEHKHKHIGFIANLKRNWKEIKIAVKMPEIYKTLMYLICSGAIVPVFNDMTYFFQLNVIKFTKFTQSMIGVLAFFCLFVGAFAFTKYLRHFEIRSLIILGIIINTTGCAMGLLQALRYNLVLGIDDVTFVVFTSTITDTLGLAFIQLPMMVLFAKVCPPFIEATVFSLLTGIYNFSNFTLSPMIGVLINRLFIRVSNSNLDDFFKLLLLQTILAPLPLFLVRLIPSRAQIHILQLQNQEQINELEKSNSLEEGLIEQKNDIKP
ncbi:UNKNOWN [Stylonychia lemnae]|uniref:Uncharacterized protein n=1 Tax=Stylonychia lemnae TaxID=5949 RepID=A0A078BBW7_STYLE|nr:UNKNOWN [Stylonychia lemnae]|eukprot:CDW91088.1 UNKNOWN [Stylonychia lemnae]